MEQTTGNLATADENHLPLSYWNVPAILRKLNKEGNSLNFAMKELGNKPIESRIEVMYGNKQVQPDCYPKTRVATGQFVDWGTKFYQLELELSYKNNEIEILKKKLKKVSQELYPEGDQGKKSMVDILRNKQLASERKLRVANEQLQQEKKKSANLSTELVQVKKRYAALRKQKLSNEKSVQTVPDNNKGTQITSRPQVKCRTIMTQCSPVPSKPKAIGSPTMVEQSTVVAHNELVEPDKTNVQFASAVTITDNTEEKSGKEPLEMSLLQEFNDGQVKTMVQANKSFKITEQPMLMSRGSYDKLKVGIRSIESPQSPDFEDTGRNLESDSGVSSVRFSSDSPHRMSPYPPNVYKPSYTQFMSQSSPNTSSRMYERNMPYYLSGDAARLQAIRSGRNSPVKMQSDRDYAPQHSHSENSFFREVQKHMIPDSTPQTVVPYHLFRREHSGNGNTKRSDKPIFVHTSEICFPGY